MKLYSHHLCMLDFGIVQYHLPRNKFHRFDKIQVNRLMYNIHSKDMARSQYGLFAWEFFHNVLF